MTDIAAERRDRTVVRPSGSIPLRFGVVDRSREHRLERADDVLAQQGSKPRDGRSRGVALRSCREPIPDVFLVGAGISRDWPAELETAGEIAVRLANELAATADDGVRRAICRAATAIRLEILLDIVAETLGPSVVERVFAAMRATSPNLNHVVLAALDVPILTTNQDVLLEIAAHRRGHRLTVVHLHGDSRHPRRVIARLSQYVHGLPPATVAEMRSLVAGRRLAVLGYSGRDLDVMQVLLDARPASVTWVTRGDTELGREVAVLQKRLGVAFRQETASADAWLAQYVDEARYAALRATVAREPPRHPLPVRRVIPHRSQTDLTLATATVLERGGNVDLAIRLVRALVARGGQLRNGQARAALVFGRLWLEKERYDRSIKWYALAGRTARDTDDHIGALQGEIESLRRSSRYADAYRRLEDLGAILGPPPGRSNDRGWAENARAGLLRMEGRAIQAHAAYVNAERAFLAAGNLDGAIEARTWRAENRMQVGDVREGLVEARVTFADSIDFGRSFTAGWPLFVAGEGLGYIGDVRKAVRQFALADDRFRLGRNLSGRAWAMLLSAAFDRPARLDRAAAKLERAERHLRHAQRLGWTWFHVESRLLLERAELARAHGNGVDTHVHLAALQRLVDGASIQQPILSLHAELVEAEVLRGDGDSAARERLTQCALAYRRLGLVGPAARAAVSAWLADPAAPPSPRLVTLCRRHFPREYHRLVKPSSDYYPIYFV